MSIWIIFLHPFHMVHESPWPIFFSFSILSMLLSVVEWFWYKNFMGLMISLIFILSLFFYWWRDVIRESNFFGSHTQECENSFKIGMLWFISSEVFFFFAFFWGFFHSSFAPTPELGCIWPSFSIISLDFMSVPLLNTAVLLSSGISVTWAHHSLMSGDWQEATTGLFMTVFLGIYFTLLQMFEYFNSSFSISDSIFGSIFFVSTGFHGSHVIIGSIFLSVCFFRMVTNHNSSVHFIGFELAAWYWHFVDVVWLFLFMCVYWWGS